MTFVAVGVGVAGAAASAAGSMMAAGAQKDAAGKASDAQVQANRDSIAAQQNALRQGNNLLRPWENSGYNAQQQLDYLLGTGGNRLGSRPYKSDFEYIDSQGVKQTDISGFQNALSHWKSNRERITGIAAPEQQAYQKAVYNKRGKLTGYKLNKKAWTAANNEYAQKVQEFFLNQEKNPQQETSTEPGGYGSLMQDYTPEQYQEDPGYTPMVNDLESLQATPGYQFRLQQGEQSVNRGAAARGGLLSGATQKALTQYGQGLASTEYQNAWQRAQQAYSAAFDRYNQNRTTKYNMLSTQAGRGQNAATAMAGAAQNAGNNISQIQQNTGNNLAGIAMQQGQNQADMWGNLANTASSLAGNLYTAGRQGGGWGNGNTYGPGGPLGPMNPTTQV